MTNWYCTLDAARTRLGLDVGKRPEVNAPLGQIIQQVCRQADSWCHRQFFVREAERVVTYLPTRRYAQELVVIPDLVRLDVFAIDTGGDRTYSTELTPADYLLLPTDALLESPPRPYWLLGRWHQSTVAWPRTPQGLRLAGAWGCYDVRESLPASVVAPGIDADPSSASLPVSSPESFAVGQTLRIGDEQLFVARVVELPDTTGQLDVLRAQNGTLPEAHSDGDAIDVYTYPIVGESVLTQVQRRYERSIGRPSRSDFDPALRAFASLDRDVQDALVELQRESMV